MSAYAQQRLKATGSANVIVPIKDDSESTVLAEHFQWSDLQRTIRDEGHEGAFGAGAATAAVRPARVPASPLRYFRNLGIGYGAVNREGWAALKKTRSRGKAPRGTPQLRPIRPLGSISVKQPPEISWGIEALHVPALWKEGLTGKGIRIAHLDTGVNADHPSLDGCVHAFAEFDPLGEQVDHSSSFDSGNHGTHTAGIIAARPVNNRAIGVAPGASLVVGIVIDGGDLVARVLAGVDWAMGKGIKILNLSLGYPEYWDDYLPVLEAIRAKGILPVFAAGNEGPGTSRSPGNYPMALSVGAMDREGRVLQQSSSQTFDRRFDPIVPDIVVPGADIISADAEGGFRADSGTSMAAPHISGLAALLWEARPDATVDQIEDCIFASCTLAGGQSKDRANRGVPDAREALRHLMANTAPPRRKKARRRVAASD